MDFCDFKRQLQVFFFPPAKPWKKLRRLFTGLNRCVKGIFKLLNTGEMSCKEQPWGEHTMTLTVFTGVLTVFLCG